NHRANIYQAPTECDTGLICAWLHEEFARWLAQATSESLLDTGARWARHDHWVLLRINPMDLAGALLEMGATCAFASNHERVAPAIENEAFIQFVRSALSARAEPFAAASRRGSPRYRRRRLPRLPSAPCLRAARDRPCPCWNDGYANYIPGAPG